MHNTLINADGRLETKFTDFRVGDLIISLIRVSSGIGRNNGAGRHAVLDHVGDFVLGEVHPFIAHVVGLAGHDLVVLQGEHEGARGVAHVEERAPEVALVQVEVLQRQRLGRKEAKRLHYVCWDTSELLLGVFP